MFENRPNPLSHLSGQSSLRADEHGGNKMDLWQRRGPHGGESAPAHSDSHILAQPGAAVGLGHAPDHAAQVMAHYGHDGEAEHAENAENAEHAPPEPAAAPLDAAAPDAADGHDNNAKKSEHAVGDEAHEAGGADAAHKQQDPIEAAAAEAAQHEAQGADGGLAAAAAGPHSAAEPEAHAGAAEHEAADEHEGGDEHDAAEEHEDGHAAHAASEGPAAAGHGEATAHAAVRRAALRAAPAAAAPAMVGASPATARPSSAHHSTFAKVDRYNPTLASNPFNDKKHQLQRPGVRVKGKDKFKVKGGAQQRYFVNKDSQVQVADRITNRNSKGKRNDIAINIAHTRKLVLEPGKPPVECVLVFVRSRGAAWMPMDGLQTGTDKSTLRKKVNEQAAHHQPHRVPKHTKFTRRTFRANVPASAIDDDYIQPNRTNGADMVDHYLQRTVETGLGSHGGPNKRSYYNVSLNLPQKKAPPTAVDTAEPGAPFFVADGSKFERQVSVFGEKKKKAKSHFAWVFGYMGKKQADGSWKPDETRRGWVPKRCLG